MTNTVSDVLLFQLSELLAARMGLHFPARRWSDLRRGIRSALQEFGFEDEESCLQSLMASPLTRKQIEILASHLTVGETYFFRDKKSFQVLEQHILPELLRSRRGTEQRLRIWSAGCATGEEPYSIAILLARTIPDLEDWQVTIVATDINPHFLRKASDGVYKEWSFRDAPPGIKEQYFKQTEEGRFELLPQVKKMVTFSYLNLAQDAYPSLLNNTNAMDVIFCRNVLMYFAPEQMRKVIRQLHRCLVDGGWLIVSPSETSHLLFSGFVTVNFPDVILYRKEARTSQAGAGALFPQPSSFDTAPHDAAVLVHPRLDSASERASEGAWSGEVLPFEVDEPTPIPNQTHQTAAGQQTRYQEAVALYERGRYEEAAEKIGDLLSPSHHEPKALTLFARIYANQGKLAEALRWCENAIAVDKINPVAHYLHATILQEQGRVEEAVRALGRALYLDPDFVIAHFALGNLARQQGKFEESNRHFVNALSLLSAQRHDAALPESDGMTAGRLAEIIQTMIDKEVAV